MIKILNTDSFIDLSVTAENEEAVVHAICDKFKGFVPPRWPTLLGHDFGFLRERLDAFDGMVNRCERSGFSSRETTILTSLKTRSYLSTLSIIATKVPEVRGITDRQAGIEIDDVRVRQAMDMGVTILDLNNRTFQLRSQFRVPSSLAFHEFISVSMTSGDRSKRSFNLTFPVLFLDHTVFQALEKAGTETAQRFKYLMAKYVKLVGHDYLHALQNQEIILQKIYMQLGGRMPEPDKIGDESTGLYCSIYGQPQANGRDGEEDLMFSTNWKIFRTIRGINDSFINEITGAAQESMNILEGLGSTGLPAVEDTKELIRMLAGNYLDRSKLAGDLSNLRALLMEGNATRVSDTTPLLGEEKPVEFEEYYYRLHQALKNETDESKSKVSLELLRRAQSNSVMLGAA